MRNIGAVYVTRGKDPNWRERCERFAVSYMLHPAQVDHRLYVNYKEFETPEDLEWAIERLRPVPHVPIMNYIDRNSNGAGCFLEASDHMDEPLIFTLNSSCEIMHTGWLARIYEAFCLPNTGLVGCTGADGFITQVFPEMRRPAYHIRGTAYMMKKELHWEIANSFDWQKPDIFGGFKQGYFEFEFGPNNMTRQVQNRGLRVWVAELHRIIAPEVWGETTYRGNLHNVLVNDRGSRDFQDL